MEALEPVPLPALAHLSWGCSFQPVDPPLPTVTLSHHAPLPSRHHCTPASPSLGDALCSSRRCALPGYCCGCAWAAFHLPFFGGGHSNPRRIASPPCPAPLTPGDELTSPAGFYRFVTPWPHRLQVTLAEPFPSFLDQEIHRKIGRKIRHSREQVDVRENFPWFFLGPEPSHPKHQQCSTLEFSAALSPSSDPCLALWPEGQSCRFSFPLRTQRQQPATPR